MQSALNPEEGVTRGQQAHVAATAFFALFSIVGLALYGLPFFYDHFITDYGWTRGQVTSGNMYSKLLVGPLFGFIAGWIIDRFGPRRMMLAGIVMAAVALIGLSYTTELWMFMTFYLFNALGYVCGGPLPNQVLISRWFDKARGKAMGLAYIGIGLGGAIVPLLAVALTNAYDWHIALRGIGVIMLLVAFPLAFFVKDAPPNFHGTAQAKAPAIPIRTVLKNPYFYLLAIGSMCSIAAVGGTNQNLKMYFRLDLQMAENHIGTVISLILASSILGRILMGWLADRFPRKYVMLLIYSIVAASIPMLFFVDQPGVIYVFAFIFGIGLGGDYMIIPLMAGDIFGVRVLGRVMGIVLTADGVAEALAPWAVARLHDAHGTYVTGFSILIAIAAVGALSVMLLPKRRVAEESAVAA